jgi:formylglycine-generating enzyme required for sulfatase activity
VTIDPGRAGLLAALAASATLVAVGAAVERLDPFPLLRFAIQRDPAELPSTSAVDKLEIVKGYQLFSLYIEPSTLRELLDHKMEHGRDWERPATFSYFDGGQLRFTAQAGVRIHGGGSRITSPRQGFRLFFRRQYGATRAPAGVLLDASSDPLRRLVIHNDVRRGGRGVLWHMVNPFGYDLARRIGAITPETKPVRFFLNGEFQGPYVLTEHFDDEYFDAHMPGRRVTMRIEDMRVLRARVDATHPLTMEAAAELLDLENVTTWFLAVLFAGTRDAYQGPGQFLDEGRERAGWFWVTWDVDESFRDWDLDTFQYLLERVGERYRGRRPSEPRGTVLTRLVAGDARYRAHLARRVDDMLNHQLTRAFTAERAAHYANIAAAYGAPSLEYVSHLNDFLDKRPAFVRRITAQWLNIPQEPVAVSVRRAGGGPLVINGFTEQTPYRGAYFFGREITVGAPEHGRGTWYVNGERAGDAAELRVRADHDLAITWGGSTEEADRPAPSKPDPPQPDAAPALVWRRVQGGLFDAGCVASDRRCVPSELPREQVRLSHAYELHATEVSVAQFREYSRRAGTVMPQQPLWSDDTRPVVNLTWNEALGFCEAHGGRLPTEAEWEFAARSGRFDDVYPWGNAYNPEHANGGGLRGRDQWAFAAPVGSFPANAYGLFDMIGNVWEWTADWFREGEGWTLAAAEAPPFRSATYLKTVRGGSWDSSAVSLRASRRIGLSPTDRHNLYVGFRCAR